MEPPVVHPDMANDTEVLERNLEIMKLQLENEKTFLNHIKSNSQHVQMQA